MIFWETLKYVFELLLKNRLISRKSLLAVSFGLMIFYVGLPLKTLFDLVQGSPVESSELMCLPVDNQYYVAMSIMALKIIMLGALGIYAIRSQKELDIIDHKNGEGK